MSTVVLVHGAFHGAWCWELVEAGLNERDIETITPELPFTGIVDDAAAARKAIDDVADPVVVCGHSYGGRVISRAASGHPGVEHLVYLAAVQAKDAMRDDGSEPTGVMTTFRTTDDGRLFLDGDTAAPYFLHDCDPTIAQGWVAQLRSMEVGPMVALPADAPQLPSAFLDIPSTYVVCTEDRIIDSDVQRAMARNANNVIELVSGHSPMLSQPDRVVALLADLAATP
jgi:pimeloyl-ACP methyl ester carboxylesterase